MIGRLLGLLIAWLPLACGLMLLRLMPQVAETPILLGPRLLVRLDPLGLVGIVLLAFGAVRPQPSVFDTFRHSLAVALAGLALLLPAALPFVVLLCAVSLLLVDRLAWNWYLALIISGIAAVAPPTLPSLPLVIVAAFVGIGGIQRRGKRVAFARSVSGVSLAPLWLMLLLRSLADGLWPLQWTLLVPLLGIAAALWAVGRALVEHRQSSVQRISAAMLLLGYAALGFGSTLGVVAVLWIVLMHTLLLLSVVDGEDGTRVVPLLALFVAAWWAAASAAAARGMLLAGAIWLVGIVGGVVVLLWPYTAGSERLRARGWDALLLVLMLATGVMSGWLSRFVAEPVAAQLGAGLSAFGLLDTWPWIGVAGLDPGHQRVAILPVAPLTTLLLVLVAAAWLVRRLWLRPVLPLSSEPSVDLAALVRRVWWLPGDEDG